ncbi:MAG TPA: hypothetical protein VF025_07290, partial [Gaiellaceae bacterium]
HLTPWLVALIAFAAILLAGIGGYAIAGGFASESSPGQKVSDGVMNAYATGDPTSIAATYDPAVKVVLIWDNAEHIVAANAKELTGVIKDSIAVGDTLKQIGPISTYKAKDGDLYVSSMTELTSPSHPDGIPIVGFYRVHNGKVIRQIGIDAEHY